MKLSYNWLKDYLKCDLSAAQIAQAMTSIGIEVDSVEEQEQIPGSLAGVVVAKVLECEAHPDSDHLHITKVDDGSTEPLTVVCGAPNVAAGQKVLFARIGTVLPGDFKIKKSKKGNNNKDVDVFYYVTKGTFDSFMYSTVDRKAKFIRQIMHGDKSIRKLELESNELSYKDIMMAGLGDSKVKEFMECKEKFDTLTMQKKFFESEFQKVSRNVKFTYPNEIKKNEQFINSCTPDIELTKKQKFDDPNLPFKITLNNNVVTDKKVFGEFLASQFKKLSPDDPTFVVGDYHGFKVGLQIDLARDKNGKLERIERIALIGTTGFNYTLQVAKVPAITISRLNTTILQIPKSVEFCQKTIDDLQTKLQGDQKYLENNQSFDKDDELIEVTQKLKQLEASLVEASQQSDGNSNTDVIENVEFEEVNDVHKDTNQENEVNQENNETEIKSVIHR